MESPVYQSSVRSFLSWCRHDSDYRPDYMPIYFQASLNASPLRSSVQTLPTALIISPFALISGMMVKFLGRYRPSNILGWLLTIVGFGLLSLLRADSSTSQWVGYQVLSSAGTGMIVSTPMVLLSNNLD